MIRLNKKYGYIDRDNNPIIPPIYGDARRFENGLAWVEKDNKWGYIDSRGKVILEMQDFDYHLFKGCVCVQINGNEVLENACGKTRIPEKKEHPEITFKKWKKVRKNIRIVG